MKSIKQLITERRDVQWEWYVYDKKTGHDDGSSKTLSNILSDIKKNHNIDDIDYIEVFDMRLNDINTYVCGGNPEYWHKAMSGRDAKDAKHHCTMSVEDALNEL